MAEANDPCSRCGHTLEQHEQHVFGTRPCKASVAVVIAGRGSYVVCPCTDYVPPSFDIKIVATGTVK